MCRKIGGLSVDLDSEARAIPHRGGNGSRPSKTSANEPPEWSGLIGDLSSNTRTYYDEVAHEVSINKR